MLQAHKALGLELPVNLKFCLEGMEESGSEGLDELIASEKDKFFKGVDAVCIVGARSILFVSLELTVPAVGQLLAEYTHTMPDLWPPRDLILQSDHHGAGSRPAFWCLWTHGARAYDGFDRPHEQARHSSGQDPRPRRRGSRRAFDGRREVCHDPATFPRSLDF